MTVIQAAPPVGELLRDWRQRRRLTQLDLSLAAAVSARHLSFIETGRSRPTSDMILHLSEQLDVPLRRRNELLLAGGFAPAFPEHQLAEAPMAAVSAAINQILAAHDPYPALVVDAHWELIASNSAVDAITAGSAQHLLEPPVNVLRLSLHPDGMAPRILNLAQWRSHLLSRLERQVAASDDDTLRELLAELRAYPGGTSSADVDGGAIVVPLRYDLQGVELSLFSTTTVFGTPHEVTTSELAIEMFYPADPETAAILRG